MIAAMTWLPVVAALAQAPEIRYRHPGEIDWKSSASVPTPGDASHEYHLLYEHKATSGVQTLVRFSKGFAMPPHTHTHDETIVVTSGKLTIGSGGREVTLKPGGYAVVPGGLTHSLSTKGGCELVVTFAGPVDFKGLPQVK